MADVVVEKSGVETGSEGSTVQEPVNEGTKSGQEGMGENKSGESVVKAEGNGKPAPKLPASIKPPQKTGRFQARISDLVAQRDQERREKEQLREQLSKMRGPANREAAGGGSESKKVAAGDGADLNPEDFPTYGEYVTALVDKTLEQKTAADQSRQAEEAYNRYKQEKLDEFNEKCLPLAELYGEGFWDAITDPNLQISEAMADAVMELGDLAPYTMLWLAAHPKESANIAKMNPRSATIHIGRLAAQLDLELKQGGGEEGGAGGEGGSTTPVVPQQALKPTPVPPVRGSAPTSLDAAPSDKDDVNTWLQKETNRLRRINPNARFYGAQ